MKNKNIFIYNLFIILAVLLIIYIFVSILSKKKFLENFQTTSPSTSSPSTTTPSGNYDIQVARSINNILTNYTDILENSNTTTIPLTKISNSKLLFYYPFDTDMLNYASGKGVNDIVNSPNTNISKNSTVLTNGSLYFSNNPGQLVQLPNFNFDKTGVTVAFWVKFENLNAGWSRFFDFGKGSESNNFGFGFPGPGQLHYFIFAASSGTTNRALNTGYVFNDKNWHHFCITIEPHGTNTTKIYVDGKPIQFSFSGYPSLDTFTKPFIGKSNWGHDGASNFYMNSFVVFNRTLNQTEIGYLYNNPKTINFTNI